MERKRKKADYPRRKDWKDEDLIRLTIRIANNVKRLRDLKGKKEPNKKLTLQVLATRAGVAASTIHEIEKGTAKNIKLSTLVALARALEISDPAELLSK